MVSVHHRHHGHPKPEHREKLTEAEIEQLFPLMQTATTPKQALYYITNTFGKSIDAQQWHRLKQEYNLQRGTNILHRYE